jgi:hypothetical protein
MKNWWEALGRILTIVGIFGGAAAVWGVWLQFNDLNQRELRREAEDWQTSIVYQIIEESKIPLSLKEISERYVNEAEKLPPKSLPREILTDVQLRLVLINLIYKAIIIERGGRYSISPVDEPESYVNSAEYQNRMARNLNIARAVIAESKTPLNSEQLLPRMIAAGGDEQFLKNNLGAFIQQIQDNHIGTVQDDGRVAAPTLPRIPVPSSPPLVPRQKKP